MVESTGENGKMSNGFYPTARYNLSDKHKDYEVEEALEENGFSSHWVDDAGSILFDPQRRSFGKHLATSPEKQQEFEDFDKGMAAVRAVSPVKKLDKPASSESNGIKSKNRTDAEHKSNARKSTEQKHENAMARKNREKARADEAYSKTKSTKGAQKSNNQKKKDNPDYYRKGPRA